MKSKRKVTTRIVLTMNVGELAVLAHMLADVEQAKGIGAVYVHDEQCRALARKLGFAARGIS